MLQGTGNDYFCLCQFNLKFVAYRQRGPKLFQCTISAERLKLFLLSAPPIPQCPFSSSRQLARECTSFTRGDLTCWIWQTLKHFRSIHNELHQDQITNTTILPVAGNQIPCTCLYPWTLLLSRALWAAHGVWATLKAMVFMSAMFNAGKNRIVDISVSLLWKTKTTG